MTNKTASHGTEKPSKLSRGKSQALAQDGPVQKPTRRRFALTSLRAVRRELGVLYWQARGDEISLSNAARLTYILTSIARVLVDADLEQRVCELERFENWK